MATAQNDASASKKTESKANSADIEEQIETLRDDIATLAKSLTNLGIESAGDVKGRAGKAAADMVEYGEAAFGSARDELRRFESRMIRRIRRKPGQSLLVAAGFGALLAILLKR